MASILVSSLDPNTPLGKLAPRKVNERLKQLFKRELDIKLVSGRSRWLVKGVEEKEMKTWSSLKNFLGTPISVANAEAKKWLVGVISAQSLALEKDEDIVSDLKSFGVMKIKNLPAKDKTRGPTFMVFFDGLQLPKEVKVGYEVFRVREYVPDPLRCFQCNKFGHSSRNCRQPEKTCIRCGLIHEIDPLNKCEAPMKCSNCGQNGHTALSRACEVFLQEKQVVSYAAAVKKPVGEIKKEIRGGLQIPNQFSYADALKLSKRKSAEVQTDDDLIGIQLPPLVCFPSGTRVIIEYGNRYERVTEISSVPETSNEIQKIILPKKVPKSTDLRTYKPSTSRISVLNKAAAGFDPATLDILLESESDFFEALKRQRESSSSSDQEVEGGKFTVVKPKKKKDKKDENED